VTGVQTCALPIYSANLFSANGSRPGQNEILLDGAPNTTPGVWPGRGILGTPVVVDSIQEFKAPRYGGTAAGLFPRGT